jgi:hypothetical protein
MCLSGAESMLPHADVLDLAFSIFTGPWPNKMAPFVKKFARINPSIHLIQTTACDPRPHRVAQFVVAILLHSTRVSVRSGARFNTIRYFDCHLTKMQYRVCSWCHDAGPRTATQAIVN